MQFFFLLPLRTFLCLFLLKTFNFVDLVTDDVISWSRSDISSMIAYCLEVL